MASRRPYPGARYPADRSGRINFFVLLRTFYGRGLLRLLAVCPNRSFTLILTLLVATTVSFCALLLFDVLRPTARIRPESSAPHREWTSRNIVRALSSTTGDSLFTAKLLPEVVPDEEGTGRPWYEYRAARGLGHRLTRIASAYHLAHRLGVGLHQEWGECPSAGATEGPDVKIWDQLFGEGDLRVGRSSASSPKASIDFTPSRPPPLGSISNEVPGYKPYSTHKLRHGDLANDLFHTSVDFYHQIRARFVQRRSERIARFLRDSRWADSFVLGLHVRTGNGEGGDFNAKNRAITDLDVWAREASKTLSGFVRRYGHSKPPLLFIATDMADLVGLIERHMLASNSAVKVAALPLETRESGTGVSYKVKDEHCIQAWEDQFFDVVLLSLADVVITARYSSFAQSMPMTILFAEAESTPHGEGAMKYPFCEFGLQGDILQCYTSLIAWKKRNQEELNSGRVVVTESWFSRHASLKPQRDSALEDTLSYPLATRDCLGYSPQLYFSNETCFRAHLQCNEEAECGIMHV
mmetsp:Transcript_16479/g.47386  ORF Transcript_16479/g.47386 Transcript_16479/m.47386 type:complete len:525 (-) Transcript_16479:215-1789(-)